MKPVVTICLLLLTAGVMFSGHGPGAVIASSDVPAKQLFGHQNTSAAMSPASIGGYAKGCLAGAAALPSDGPFHQAMRPSRNRNWGHPELVAMLDRLSQSANREANWPGLLIGDLSQPRGGPMLTGHASHQIGLDADIWLMPAPPRPYTPEERNEVSAVSVLAADKKAVDPTIWTDGHGAVIRAAARDRAVARIFVHPAIKRALCSAAGNDRSWLRKVRPWYGHHYHFHVRLSCPKDSRGCVNQAAPPPGDGCGASLDWWFTEEPYKPAPGPPKPPLKLADLPST
ncbi:MAG: penicillin-insensitive murein endopeptidase, partial [Fimbriimonadaceae bacterium]|nr:penicillin-insensitive murein endopeptidase [Alphaproteobacteria bacterium]